MKFRRIMELRMMCQILSSHRKVALFFMTCLLMNVSRKNSLLMAIRQFHMHHTMDFNMLVI
ncbi:hypothetical protein CF138_21270 [Aeromonas hydrophila]|nr:hypothetical protein CF138_21270 [Aeromonas hydrophila]TNI01300.1 hypothetical protein CF136_07985 [Aeromonas hydrophila]TNI91535.1 hypothetical protein CF118_20780 [Aeromonas hydrophila]